jgi:cytochrome c553
MKFLVSGLLFFLGLGFNFSAHAATPDWSEGIAVPVNGRTNPYGLSPGEFLQNQTQGKLHAQIYPVEITGMLPPYRPVKNLIEGDSKNPLRKFLNSLMRRFSGYREMNDLLADLGLHEYPKASDQGVYAVPYPNGQRPTHLMGFGLIETRAGTGFSFSCAACHSANLFGKTVLGLTNRFPHANEFFVKAKTASEAISPKLFQLYTKATDGETEMMSVLKENMKSVGVKDPIAPGLDTSLAQVALSLNHRNPDEYATKSFRYAHFPRRDINLDEGPADSKPAVWWNVKYKNRWLSDGSVVSGNPIYTNILWNEIGRGADLRDLETWLDQNPQKVQELTTAVFSSEAPALTDFFPAEKIDRTRAQAGETVFNDSCARCHGTYEKAWSLPNAAGLSSKDLLKTVQVKYRQKTPVVDVGTDPYRRLGMKSLEQLNDLAISKRNHIRIEAQEGYVPPPLVGIWARWPYMHNNSVPNLCALLTASAKRPKIYYSGEAQDPQKDFDFECNGYPLGDKAPAAWKTPEHSYDTRVTGLSNAGHDEGIFLENGKELLTTQQKRDLILFLQTL